MNALDFMMCPTLIREAHKRRDVIPLDHFPPFAGSLLARTDSDETGTLHRTAAGEFAFFPAEGEPKFGLWF